MTDHRNYHTLVDVLQDRARSEHSITFIEGQGNHHSISFAQMLQRSLQRLAEFQAAGVESAHHMILQCSDNSAFLEGFWACLLGGIVAVPVAGGNSAEHRQKLFRIAQMLDNPALFTDEKNLSRVQTFAAEHDLATEFSELEARCCLTTSLTESSSDSTGNAVIVQPSPNDTAFIQFSSGSTSTPKGIVLTHKNLLTNTGSIIEGCLMSSSDHLLSWMPLTHDMGLIGFHLTPLVCDTSHSLIPTDVFVRRPGIWLSETQHMQATILCSPNFGYQHLLKSFKPEKHEGLDLSSVRLLFNGAEPISVALCREFMQTLQAFELDPHAMFPVYGLAEASLGVTFPSLDNRFTSLTLARSSLTVGEMVSVLSEENAEGVQFVAVGKPLSHVELAIRDENNSSCIERVTGRICIRGLNVTSGYYKDPELNAQLIDSEGWLDTGDLGFISDGQLYITGRAKDIIFINGQNVYPHDLEELLVQQQLIERGKLAVASCPDPSHDTEQLLVFVLHRGDISELETLARDITRTLGIEAGVRVDAVVAVPRIPKTTSGKVQRFQLITDFQKNEFKSLQQTHIAAVDAVETPSANEQSSTADIAQSTDATTASQLLSICNIHVEGIQVALADNLFELGISSLTLAEIHASIEDTWPDQVEITDLFDYPTVAELANFLDQKA